MSLLDDVRALGVGAPLRAGYEASKRFGGHTLVFSTLARRPMRSPRLRLLPLPDAIPEAVAASTIVRADAIVDGRIEIFSRELVLGCPPDWSAHLDREGRWPPLPWWKIDIRSDARAADVKWTWELGRFRHVVLLARACHLCPADAPYAGALVDHLTSFLDDNLPETGVHWYSNLELALRAWALLQVVSLAERSLGPALVERISDHLWRIGRHLLVDVPYTISTMRNNHLLGDGVGMCAVGYAFGETRFGRRLTRVGDRLVGRFLGSGTRPDGSFLEDSLSYHRFVLELLSARVSLGGASSEAISALRGGGDFLGRLGVFDGPVPQYGDWDEGRALTTAGDACDVRGSALVALTVGERAPAAWRADYDELAWYVAEGGHGSMPDAVIDGRAVGGGLGRAVAGSFTSFSKTAAGHSHNHADAGSTFVLFDGSWIVHDPGTGAYNAELAHRTYFRESRSHSTMRIGDVDQLEPLRVFRWKHRASGGIGEPVRLRDGSTLSWCWHDAYRRLEQPTFVVHTTLTTVDGVYVADWTETPVDAQFAVCLAPEVDLGASASFTVCGVPLVLDVPAGYATARGAQAPFDGWSSRTYGDEREATRVSWSASGQPPFLWAVRRDDGPIAVVDGRSHVLGDVSVRVGFAPGAMTLSVVDGSESHVRRVIP